MLIADRITNFLSSSPSQKCAKPVGL